MLLLLSIILEDTNCMEHNRMLMTRIAMNVSRDAVMKPCPYSLTVLESVVLMMKLENILRALKYYKN
jgi:hypothetical protein